MKNITWMSVNKKSYCKDCGQKLTNGWGGGSWCEDCGEWK